MEWTRIKNTPGISYENADKTALRMALFEEQGGLCGYCMSRISCAPEAVSDTRIEHLKPRRLSIAQGHPEETLSYSNMILCCNGDIDRDGNFHCDRRKEDREISFTPFDEAAISTISYSSKDGRIGSSNRRYDDELNNVLNLNHPRLSANRSSVIKGLVKVLGKSRWGRADLEHKIDFFKGKTADGRYHEYCGVIVWYLTKKLRQYVGNPCRSTTLR